MALAYLVREMAGIKKPSFVSNPSANSQRHDPPNHTAGVGHNRFTI